MHGSGKLQWGRGLCTMCDQCRAISSLSHPITGWTLTRLTGAGQSSFCSLTTTVSHVARERWLEAFWILLIGSRYRNAHWDLWNRTMLFASKCMDTYNLIFIVHVVFIIFQQETHLTNPKLRYSRQISHNAPFCICILGHGTVALWDLLNRSTEWICWCQHTW